MFRYQFAQKKLTRILRQHALVDQDNPNRIKILKGLKRQILEIKEANPDYIGASLAYAQILMDLKDTDGALREFEALESRKEDEFRYNWRIHHSHGVCLNKIEEDEKSIALFEKIIHFDKKVVPAHLWPTARQQAEAHNALAIVYVRQGKRDLWLAHLQLATSIDKNYAPAWSGLGKYYRSSPEKGSQKSAEECFEKARTLCPPRFARLHPDPELKSQRQKASLALEKSEDAFHDDLFREAFSPYVCLDYEADFPPLLESGEGAPAVAVARPAQPSLQRPLSFATLVKEKGEWKAPAAPKPPAFPATGTLKATAEPSETPPPLSAPFTYSPGVMCIPLPAPPPPPLFKFNLLDDVKPTLAATSPASTAKTLRVLTELKAATKPQKDSPVLKPATPEPAAPKKPAAPEPAAPKRPAVPKPVLSELQTGTGGPTDLFRGAANSYSSSTATGQKTVLAKAAVTRR